MLFTKYGFSGNGYSIEQVIERKLGTSILDYDSENDAFYARVSPNNYERAMKELKCLENLECLNQWLKESQSKLFKE